MALLEKTRIEVYLPDLPTVAYQKLLNAFAREFTYSFGGCTVNRGLDGNYLSRIGVQTPDRINLIYTDIPAALSTNFQLVAAYAGELKQTAFASLSEEVVLVVVQQVYHTV